MQQLLKISLDDETRLELTFSAIVDIPAVGCWSSGLNGPTQPKLNKLCGLQPMYANLAAINNKSHGLSPPGGFSFLSFEKAVPYYFQGHLTLRNAI